MKRGNRYSLLCLLIAFLLASASCTTKNDLNSPANGLPTVITTCLPLASLVKELAGDQVEIIYPVTVSGNAQDFLPDEEIIGQMQAAEVLLLNGAGYEPWTEQVMLSPLNQTVTAMGFRAQWIKLDTVTHRHGPEGEHTHSAFVPYTWLDPLQLTEQLLVTTRVLQTVIPWQREELEQKREKIQTKLAEVDTTLKQAGELLNQQPIISSQPVYQYPARRYLWNLKSLAWPSEKIPDAEMWASLDQILEKHPARLLLCPAEPTSEIQQELSQRGIQVVVFSTMTSGDPSIDVVEQLAENANRLLSAAKKVK